MSIEVGLPYPLHHVSARYPVIFGTPVFHGDGRQGRRVYPLIYKVSTNSTKESTE